MFSLLIGLQLAFFLFLLTFSRCHSKKNLEFCYKEKICGPESDLWAGECKTGHHQSPIDLINGPDPKMAILDFNGGYRSNEFWIRNNVHSVQVNLESEATSNGKMSGYGFERPYIFAQIHFHWGEDNQRGSEHTLAGTHFAMEVHLVHYDSKYQSFAEAESSGDPKGLAVLSVFLTAGSESDANEAFDLISSNLPLDYQENEKHIGLPLDIYSFLPQIGATFFRYMGSLTTPDCTEAVEWTVLTKPILVRPSAIEKFRKIRDPSGNFISLNYRPVQNLGDRMPEYLVKI